MNPKEIANYIDHTQLKAFAAWEDIKKLCEEAVKYQTASVCIPPSYVKRVKEAYADRVNICTVIGFPLGYQVTAVKEAEVRQAVADGAAEVDMVVNLGDVKNGDFEKVTEEIRTLKQAANGHILKVIVETCYLTEEEKIALCNCVTKAGADYIKTSTGFGAAGAAPEDIKLFKNYIGKEVKIKAAGGIRTPELAKQYIELGCERIGSSSLSSWELEEKKPDMAQGSQNLSVDEIKNLINHAFLARENAYCPYSGFAVGAALLTKDNAIFTGCNIESAAFSPTNCAERTALFKAISEGVRKFRAIAIVGGQKEKGKGEVEYCAPCGVCRQVLEEFCPKEFSIIFAKDEEQYEVHTLGELLPFGFGGANLLK